MADAMKKSIILVLATALAACALGCNSIHETFAAAERAPQRANLRFITPELAAGLRLREPILSPAQEFFRSPEGIWGEGRRMGPLWVYDLPDGTGLDGMAMLSLSRMAVLETPATSKQPQVLRLLDAEGHTVSSHSLSGFFTSLDAGFLGGQKVLLAKSGDSYRVMDADGRPVWKAEVAADQALLADLGGDGRGELVISTGSRGAVAALAADGSRLWGVAGFGEIYGLAAAARAVAVFCSSGVVILDGGGREIMRFQDDTMPERGVFLTPQDSALLLAHAGSNLGTSRERLRISRIEGMARSVQAEVEIGPTRVVAMIAPDLNGDGRRDLALGTENGWVFLYDEHAQLWGEKRHFGRVPSLAAGDINGDGWEELVAGMRGNTSRVYAYGAIAQPAPQP